MKILFIIEINYSAIFSGSLPIAIPMLAAVLKKNGHEVRIASKQYSHIKIEMDKFKPDVVGFSVYTGEHQEALHINKKLKTDFKGFISLMGGPHPTYFSEIIYEEGVDAICIGDGFEGLPNFLKKLEGSVLDSPIKNIWWKDKDKGTIVKYSTGFITEDVSTLPMPAYEIYEKYLGNYWPVLSYMAGFGCPFKCSYCFNPVKKMLKSKFGIRRKNPSQVVHELRHFSNKYSIKYISFLDDVFTIDKSWLKEFAFHYANQVNLPFSCITRIELIDEEKLTYLKSAGAYLIFYGIESGNDYIRNVILKRNQEKAMIIRNARLIRKYNIKSYTFNIFNIPGETIENAMETFKLNIDCKPTYAEAFQLVPFPKTSIHEYAVSNGYYSDSLELYIPVTLKQSSKIKNKDYQDCPVK